MFSYYDPNEYSFSFTKVNISYDGSVFFVSINQKDSYFDTVRIMRYN